MGNINLHEFESRDLLFAVEQIDEIRYALADGENLSPPKVRSDLMALHQMVFDVSKGALRYEKEDIISLIEEVLEVVEEIREKSEKVIDLLIKLDETLNKEKS